MISALHLLWIIPIAFVAGFVVGVRAMAGIDEYVSGASD